MRRIALVAIGLSLLLVVLVGLLQRPGSPVSPLQQVKDRYARKPMPVVDHTKFSALQRNFRRPQDVTLACLSCHTERHKDCLLYTSPSPRD